MRKVLVANRSEIAVRVFRAAQELGLRTVAVYTPEDVSALHRTKASEAYEIGGPGHPVRGYLDIDALLTVAKQAEADALHPGYGFLSESAVLADACATAGVTFVGPPPAVLRLTGDKVAARDAALAAGLPVLRASVPLPEGAGALAAAEEVGFPLFVKASAGGGGRGLRRVERPADLADAVASASREAAAAFGDGTIFLEQAVDRPRHIEVQILADAYGNIIHLYERDCSVQRRHQKVVEIAPAPQLDEAVRASICADAVRFARHVGYVNAGTVEFLLGADDRYTFMEMNPRIQVEHTVTEEVTGVDLVAAQLRIADGESLAGLNLTQEQIVLRSTAIQCRVTTEDPSDGFRPDIGTISFYQSPGGPGVRLDGATYPGAEVSPYFDSLLVKLTTRGNTLEKAARRARRALNEFRVRGVRTNIDFLVRLLADPGFLAGGVSTSFIDERPELLAPGKGADPTSRLLARLAESTVNGFPRPAVALTDPRELLPPAPAQVAASGGTASGGTQPPAGSRQLLTELGPAGWAAWLRAQEALAVTDTTLRDAHQSLLATRLRSFDILAAAPSYAALTPNLLSLEAWGGATYDVALRFLAEDPWERLAALRQAAPNICLQMLLRGRNAVGYTPYPDDVVRAFVAEAAATGVDIFRIFDALNDIEQMRPAIEAVLGTGAIAEGTLCYTGDLSDPAERIYTLDYYLRLAEELVETGVHVLAVKDMAGLLRPAAAATLVTALRERFDRPVHLHTHDTAGGQLATLLAASAAGVDAVDAAAAPMSGGTSQVNMSALVAATDHTPRATGIALSALSAMEPYWEAVRDLYAPFEAGLRAPTGAVYRHEIPGGQLTNLRQQAIALGLGDRWAEVTECYAIANELLGKPIKVTPTSKVVGDLALFIAGGSVDVDRLRAHPEEFDLPASVLGYLAGELGTPPAGFAEPFRERALAGRRPSPPSVDLDAADADELSFPGARRVALSRLLFPGPWKDYLRAVDAYGDSSVVPTDGFLYGLRPGVPLTVTLEPGVEIIVELETLSEPDDSAMRTLYLRVNGQPRPVRVRDASITATTTAARRADAADPNQVGAGLPGIVTFSVAVGDTVTKGQRLAVVEAMKMEAAVTSPVGGTVVELVRSSGDSVEVGDLLLTLRS
ncbi:pyruvate carboxylase [Frankia casuarinae]|uniref:Pyruvate carboxylase n=2 Tax=Frankia casuarinae (strain DSM 45818 / CECT 9043 / HFP020203 / CcI3) TaxID=106370 RepID=Q2JG88_FRACC|nr:MULTISPECIES: pyruvate carboxylase [Frankia]ABD09704.1 pyruvate carboxylase [Frankia casuarinae]ETA02314.1 pyruvate carboxylase [Frankia sp. CcI6]EYT92947.1 pyruvate carboxylase [Frankia casuarinae]KDA43348.1 pyruvate carboxylase [Frankia sp. BMG5.23]OHV54741.1 pyruvate carboxylase [Frankia sp. CgIS1]